MLPFLPKINWPATVLFCSVASNSIHIGITIWAATRENLSSGFPTKRVSNKSPQLQRLDRKLKFHL